MASGVGGEVAYLKTASQSVDVDLKSVSSGSSFTTIFAELQRIGDAHKEKLRNDQEQVID